jgi:mannose-1-phosphate guanylyltransferase
MLPVAGVPFLQHQIAKLRGAGIEHIVLATSYRAEVFSSFFGDGERFGVRLTYAEEAAPLGTGGAIANAAALLRAEPDAPIVIYNGDVLSAHDLSAQVAYHCDVNASVTLHLVEVPDTAAFGCVPTDPSGWVTAFLEKMPNPTTQWVNAGCYVFRRSVMDTIPLGTVVSVERQTFPSLLSAGHPIASWKESTYWLDVGTPNTLIQASTDLVQGVFVSGEVVGAPAAALSAPSAEIDPLATLSGGTYVGSDAHVSAHADVDSSIVMPGAVVGAGARVARSVVGASAHVEAGAHVVNQLIGDSETVPANATSS